MDIVVMSDVGNIAYINEPSSAMQSVKRPFWISMVFNLFDGLMYMAPPENFEYTFLKTQSEICKFNEA